MSLLLDKKIFFGFFLGLLLLPSLVFAWSQNETLFVDSNYDLGGRNQIDFQLIKTTNKLYFYADKN
ncbi:MAG: hypothetical protein ACP5RX_03375, partial [Minisyncoccia bacterium]